VWLNESDYLPYIPCVVESYFFSLDETMIDSSVGFEGCDGSSNPDERI